MLVLPRDGTGVVNDQATSAPKLKRVNTSINSNTDIILGCFHIILELVLQLMQRFHKMISTESKAGRSLHSEGDVFVRVCTILTDADGYRIAPQSFR